MLKRKIKKLITVSRPLLRIVNRMAGDIPKVFVWHRFTPPGKEVYGRVSADVFGWQLDQIQKGFQVVTLGEMLRYFQAHQQWPKRCVVLTVDDGYRDFYQWAYPQIKKRGLKATFFATVNFVEEKIWLWPDRLQWALDKTSAKDVVLSFHNETQRFPLNDLHDKSAVWKSCSDYCITLPDEAKETFIRSLEEALGVSCPGKPTEEYRAVTWEELREMDGNGIEIGSHTMNHPILSRIGQDRLIEEVGTSKRVLEEKMGHAISTFCYPNSGPGDITDDVIEAVRRAGYLGAVFGIDLKSWQPYTIPRMGVGLDRTDFLWKLYGGESL